MRNEEALNEAAREVAEHFAGYVDDIGDCLACELQNEAGDHEDWCPVGRYARIKRGGVMARVRFTKHEKDYERARERIAEALDKARSLADPDSRRCGFARGARVSARLYIESWIIPPLEEALVKLEAAFARKA